MKNSYHYTYFFYQKLPMGTVTYKVAGLFGILVVFCCCCCLFVVEKSYIHIFFTSPKKNQKHSISFWYFFRNIFLTWNYFYPTETYFCDLSETLRNFLHLRSQKHSSDFKSESSPIHISENRLFHFIKKKPVILK